MRGTNIIEFDHGTRALQQFGEIARIVNLRIAVAIQQAGVVGHGLGLDQIARAHVGRVHAQLCRQPVDDALHCEHRFGPAGAAVRRGEAGIGQRSPHRDMRVGHVVGAQQMGQCVVRHHQPDDVIGAEIDNHVIAHCKDIAVLVGGHGDAVHLVARMCRRGQVLATFFNPANRAAEFARGKRHQRIFHRLYALLPEAATHVAGNDTNALNRHAQCAGKNGLQHMRCLGARPYRERAAKGFDDSKDAARLHRRGDITVGAELFLHHHCRAGKGRVRVSLAGGHRQRKIGIPCRLDQRRAGLERFDRVSHHRQVLILDLNQLERIERRDATLGNNHRHRVADVGDFFRREQRDRMQTVERLQFALQTLGRMHLSGHTNGLGGVRCISGGEHTDDTGKGARGACVDADNLCMRMGAADKNRVQRPLRAQVGEILPLAAQQAVILHAADRLAYHG